MDDLYIYHRNIEYEGLVKNKYGLTEYFDTTQHIFNLFKRYKDIGNLATKGGQPISSQDKISLAYVLLKTSVPHKQLTTILITDNSTAKGFANKE